MMATRNFLSLAVLAMLSAVLPLSHGKNIFCYYSSFAQTRQGLGNFLPEDIDPHLCTHIIYAFVDITSDGRDIRPFNRNDQGPKGLYARTLALKEINPDLKVLLAVGGWQIGSKPFIPMITNEANRRTWVQNVVRYLRSHGFDGFDVDWEFPATRGSPPEDKFRFTSLMKELYETFARESEETGRDKLLLTMATASGTYYINQSYEPEKIINYLDFMLLMTYNYHGQWEKKTGHHSGLWSHPDDPQWGEKAQLYQQWSIDYWLNVGIPKSKLIVGIPTYGMSFTLMNEEDSGVHAPAIGGGKMGDYTRESGILAYYEICLNIKNKGWESVWIDEQLAPYVHGGDQWAGYENLRSTVIKAKNIKKRDLAGAFVWSVEMDDFRGSCGHGQYPLLHAIVDVLGNEPLSKSAAAHPAPKQWRPAPESHEDDEADEEENEVAPIYNTEVKAGAKKALRMRFKKAKRRQNWVQRKAKSQRSRYQSAEEEEENDDEVAMTTPMTTTTAPEESTIMIRWWPRQKLNKRKKWLPKRRTTTGMTARTSSVTRRPRKMWKKRTEAPRPRMAQEFSSDEEDHDVTSWQTTPWWQSGNHNLRGAAHPDSSFNARATGKPGLGLQKETTTEYSWQETPSYEVVTQASAAAGAVDCRTLGAGTFADPHDCHNFVICLHGDWLEYPPHIMTCPTGTKYDSNLRICNHSEDVEC